MNYGLYLAASGVLTNMHKQDVLTNNLANVATVGFKPNALYFKQRLPHRVETGSFAPQHLLERLGGAQMIDDTRIMMTQGTLTQTGNALDVGLQGEGFLVVGPPGAGNDQLRLTRDGRMAIEADGTLVMTSTGLPVLDAHNKVIRLDRAAHTDIDGDGDITQDGKVKATLRIASPQDIDNLVKAGNNLFRLAAPGQGGLRPAGARVVQRHTEASAVNPIMALNALVKTAKAAMANIKMMQFNDHIIGQAVNTMGRVA